MNRGRKKTGLLLGSDDGDDACAASPQTYEEELNSAPRGLLRRVGAKASPIASGEPTESSPKFSFGKSSRAASFLSTRRQQKVPKNTPRDNYAKMASIESLDLASSTAPPRADAGTYSRESLELGECLDDYFSTMKQRSTGGRTAEEKKKIRDEALKLEKMFTEEMFSQSMRDDMTWGGSTVASTSLTIRTEPTLRPSNKQRKKKKSKHSEKKPKRRSQYAQIMFDGDTSDVKFSRVPKTKRKVQVDDDDDGDDDDDDNRDEGRHEKTLKTRLSRLELVEQTIVKPLRMRRAKLLADHIDLSSKKSPKTEDSDVEQSEGSKTKSHRLLRKRSSKRSSKAEDSDLEQSESSKSKRFQMPLQRKRSTKAEDSDLDQSEGSKGKPPLMPRRRRSTRVTKADEADMDQSEESKGKPSRPSRKQSVKRTTKTEDADLDQSEGSKSKKSQVEPVMNHISNSAA